MHKLNIKVLANTNQLILLQHCTVRYLTCILNESNIRNIGKCVNPLNCFSWFVCKMSALYTSIYWHPSLIKFQRTHTLH